MDESLLIPYQASELAGARILVLAAHPDDEILGAGGALALNVDNAEAIRIWIATDGARQEGAEPTEAVAYGQKRRDESRLAAERLGLEAPVFGELPDRELGDRADLLSAAVDSLIADFRPDLVLCPSPVEIHPDHRALAEALYERVAGSRPADSDHDLYRFLRLAFYEISHPLLPNVLVDISKVARRKEGALGAYESQQTVRDYAGAVGGLNAYRRLTLDGAGPVEAFRVLDYAEASTRSLEEFRRSIGPTVIQSGERGPAPVSIVVRTRNRPALLREALESLRAQTARPRQVVIVNDGGGSLAEIVAPFRESFELTLEEHSERRGRSAAANAGVASSGEELIGFLDDDDRAFPDHVEKVLRAYRGGPEPVVYADAVTVVYGRRGDDWEPVQRALQYSLDFDPDYLLFANYIPLHTLLLPRHLFTKLGGFDPALDYSEDWDFLIRLSFEVSFRHVRGVTCEYRVFRESEADPTHAAAGDAAFQDARRKIYARYQKRRRPEGLPRIFDRLRAQIAFWYERDGISQGELRYQRESHRQLNATLARAAQQMDTLDTERGRLEADRAGLRGTLESEKARFEAERAGLEGRFKSEKAAWEARLADRDSESQGLEAERKRLEGERAGLEAKLAIQKTHAAALEAERARLENEAGGGRRRIAELEGEIARREAEALLRQAEEARLEAIRRGESERLETIRRGESERLESQSARLEAEAARLLTEELRQRERMRELETERRRVLAENELFAQRLAEIFATNERYDRELKKTRAEIDRLNGVLAQIFRSKTWKVHVFLDRLRGRS